MGKLTQEQKEAVMRGDLKEAGLIDETEQKPEESKEAVEATDATEQKADEAVTETSKEVAEDRKIDFELFREKFGKEINDEESLKSLFEKADKYEQTDKEYQDALKKISEYKNIADKVDPLSHFLNEDEFKRQQLLISKGDKLSEDVIEHLSRLTPSKVNKMSDAEALKLDLMVDKGLTEKEAETYLLNKYQIEDFSEDDIEEGVKTTIKVDAIDARRNVGKLYDGIELPSKPDYETARTQLEESWREPVPELIKSIDKVQIADGIDFVVTDEMKKGLEQEVMDWVMSKQITPSEDAAAEIVGMVRDKLVIQNIDKVVKSAIADEREKWKAENRSQIHNSKPLQESTRDDGSEESNDDKMKRLL